MEKANAIRSLTGRAATAAKSVFVMEKLMGAQDDESAFALIDKMREDGLASGDVLKINDRQIMVMRYLQKKAQEGDL
jgi:hypothetical protein